LDLANNQYFSLGCATGSGSAAKNEQVLLPQSGTLRNLRVRVEVAPGAGKNWTFQTVKNDVVTGLSCTVSDGNTTAADTVNTLALAAGDRLSLKVTTTAAGAASAGWAGIDFDSDSAARFPAMNVDGTYQLERDDPSYTAPCTYCHSCSASAIGHRQRARAGTLKAFRVRLTSEPGYYGKSWTFTVHINGNPTAMSVTISGLAMTGSYEGDIAVADGDLLTVYVEPHGTPNSACANFGLAIVES
jgi:hypothetical protein